MGKDSHKSEEKEHRDARKSEKEHKHKKDKKDKKDERKESKHRRHVKEDRREPEIKIDDDDYFAKNEEFRVWLKVQKELPFESLNTKEARKIFEKEFVKEYNKGKLKEMYYTGNIPLDLRESVNKTQHKWGLRLSEKDKIQLSDLVEDVDHLTRDSRDSSMTGNNANSQKTSTVGTSTNNSSGNAGHVGQHSSNSNNTSSNNKQLNAYEADNRRDGQKAHYQQTRIAEKTKAKHFIEEHAPKEIDGRARMIDARKTKGDAIHGAHRAKEDDRDGLNLSESFVMGGDTASDYARMLERSKHNTERKQSKISERAMELQQKEREREANFMSQLGIDPSKGRIMIAPRKD